MLGQRGPNDDGSHSLRWPNVGNPYWPNATLLVGSTWEQHDCSLSGQLLLNVKFNVKPTFAKYIFSSPEPKAQGEFICSVFVCHPSVRE